MSRRAFPAARLLVLALVAAALLRPFGAWAATGSVPPPAGDPQRLTFLLEYVGTDYEGAVRDGRVVNAAEYGEVLRFTRELIREYGARADRADEVVHGLVRLEEAIVHMAPADEVWAASRRLLPALSRALGSEVRPLEAPDLADGRRLFAGDCAICHGPTGGGDGPASGGMDPVPTPFRGEYLERLSPAQIYRALSLGVDGTAMPSFALGYTEQQRWNVAFFIPTLRVEFEPRRPPAETGITLADLAGSSNVELLARLRQARPDASPAEVDYLRQSVAEVDVPKSPAAPADGAPGGLGVALQLQDAFAGVAERVLPRVVGVTGYVRDPAWSPEKLRAERGDGWLASNADVLRYPGFRPLRTASGLLVDDQGYVLSSDQVVRDDRGNVVALVDIELYDQTHFACGVVGTEPTLGLAVLRIAGSPTLPDDTPALELGDSDRLQVGHWLIAVGDPPGPEKVFTVGVVASAAQRQCYQEQMTATRVQSSLAVPPAGLGGPVVDIFGRVVGLSVRQDGTGLTAARPKRGAGRAAADTAGAETAATHTLPINLVLNLFEALKVAQSRRSPWLGISVLELPALRRRLGAQAKTTAMPSTGVYIDDVFQPSPASRAGVRPGDFLLGLGGHQLLSVGDFQSWLYVLGIGTRTELALMRDGKPLTVTAPIEVRPESATTR